MQHGMLKDRHIDAGFTKIGGARIDNDFEYREIMRKHAMRKDYYLTHMLADLRAGIVAVDMLDTHIQCVQAGEGAKLGRSLSADDVRAMVQGAFEHHPETIDSMDEAVREALGFKVLVR